MKNAEYILFLRKGKAKPINNISSKTVHHYKNILKTKKHPTEKPVELMELYIKIPQMKEIMFLTLYG